jgi:hypothetical protein
VTTLLQVLRDLVLAFVAPRAVLVAGNRTAQDVGSGWARTPAVGEQVVDLRGRVILDS